jgi:stage III sporulation protein AD
MIGVSYIAEFGAKICEDAGEHSIAEAVRIAAKVILLSLSLPIIISLLRIVKNLIYL